MDIKEAMARLPPLKQMREAIREERNVIMQNHIPYRRKLPFARNREACLYALDANDQRLNDGDWHAWDGTKRQVAKLLMRFPECSEIFYDGGVNFAETMQDFEYGNYDPEFLQAVLYAKDHGPLTISVRYAEAEMERKEGA